MNSLSTSTRPHRPTKIRGKCAPVLPAAWKVAGPFLSGAVPAADQSQRETTVTDKKFKVDWDAEERGNMWLAAANEAEEKGNLKKAEKCLQKGQYWLDRANKARGWS